jgi:hypothetical protein
MEGLNVLTVEQERQLPRTCRLRPPPPRSPQELLEMLVHIFPNYRASDTNPILDGAASFDSVLTAFRPFFGAGAASFSEQQIRAFSSLMVGAAFLNGPLANAFTTCIIEHLDRINAREALWRFLSPNARDAVRRASTSNP